MIVEEKELVITYTNGVVKIFKNTSFNHFDYRLDTTRRELRVIEEYPIGDRQSWEEHKFSFDEIENYEFHEKINISQMQ